jgi:hypothetical protein
MKTIIVSLVISCASANAQGQIFQQRQPFPTDNRPLSGEEWRLQLVEQLISLPSPVTNGAVQLWGMGDEAAVDVLKVLSSKSALTPDSTASILDVVHMAFQHPESIISPVNQKPQAASFLLQHLRASESDTRVKERIDKEIANLQSVNSALASKATASQK